MKNVIDITRRLKKNGRTATRSKSTAPVIDMTEKRNEMISRERRQVKRTLLSEFVGAFALVPRKGLMEVTLYDISENGLSFDIEEGAGHFSIGEEVAMRVYMNRQTYFPFVVTIQNIRGIDDEKVYRHGVNFVKGTINDEALYHFVKFIETVSASLHADDGDIVVSHLTR
jgi:hypothetical protein